jgi:hypothetical protein
MRLKLSALFLSTALATGFGAGALVLSMPVAPVAMAQDAALQAGEVDVDTLLKLLPPDVKATYGSKSYDALTGVTTIRNLKIADATAEAANYLAVEEVGLRGLDLAAFEHVFDFSKYGPTRDETFKQLFGDVTVRKASIVAESKTVGGVEQITFGGVQMKQLQNLPPGQGGVTESDVNNFKFIGALLDSIISGPLEVTNFTVEAEGNKSSIAKATMGGITRGQFGPSSLENFEASSEGSFVKIASSAGDGGDFSKALPWMIKGELPPVAPDPLLYIGGGKATGIDYDIEGIKVTIAEYSISPVNFFWLVPSTFKLDIVDLVVTPPAVDNGSGFTVAELQKLGIDRLDLDFGLDWAMDATAGTAQLKELRIQESQLVDATLAIDLNGINLAQLIDPSMSQMSMMQIGLTYAKFFLKNNGGVEKMLNLAAQEEGSTPDALKQQAMDQLTQLEAGVPGPDGAPKPPSDRVKSIIAALKSFIQSPGTLTVTVQPASPVTATTGMGAMFDPFSAPDTLGVTVESTGK